MSDTNDNRKDLPDNEPGTTRVSSRRRNKHSKTIFCVVGNVQLSRRALHGMGSREERKPAQRPGLPWRNEEPIQRDYNRRILQPH